VIDTLSILLIGAGGHCKSCIDLISSISEYSIAGIVDRDGSLEVDLLGLDILGTDSDLEELISKFPKVLISTGQIKSPVKRIELFEYAKKLGASFPIIKSPHSFVSKTAMIDEGTVLFHFTVVNSSARIGRNSIINNNALVEHDTQIGSHCHVSTGALINGGVVIEDGCFIGSGAVLHEGITIGKNSIIGAGKVVKDNISPHSIIR